ncbi:hypothetical protein ACP3T3_07965 [Chryseobacterium sp. CBSDS_008]|uniref:hypothetical protein n=1 Tax=Chryseobacterium sp. CBSDS_008 TaxID=3415265 RepID=UPI003CF3C78E
MVFNTLILKYNGKELQETGMFDYGARMYSRIWQDGELLTHWQKCPEGLPLTIMGTTTR